MWRPQWSRGGKARAVWPKRTWTVYRRLRMRNRSFFRPNKIEKAKCLGLLNFIILEKWRRVRSPVGSTRISKASTPISPVKIRVDSGRMPLTRIGWWVGELGVSGVEFWVKDLLQSLKAQESQPKHSVNLELIKVEGVHQQRRSLCFQGRLLLSTSPKKTSSVSKSS